MSISLESHDVPYVGFVAQHLYIVYRDDAGDEYVIGGGPERTNPPDFGRLVVEPGVEINESEEGADRASPEQRGSVPLDLGGRDDAHVWKIMTDHAAIIDDAELSYRGTLPYQTCNSVVSSVLRAAGIDPYSVTLPTNASPYEFFGRENSLKFLDPVSHSYPPEVTAYDTYEEGDLIFLRLHYMDPDGDAEGFGFRGAKGSGWAEETHPFSDPSYGRVSEGTIAYPFNHLAASDSPIESDVEAWIYDSEGLRSEPVTVHLRSQSQVLKEVSETTDPIPTDDVPFFILGGSNSELDPIGGTAM